LRPPSSFTAPAPARINDDALRTVPRPGEVQRWSVPRTGGYAMLVGLWLALFVAYLVRDRFLIDPELGPEWNPSDDLRIFGLVLGSLCIVPLAVLDDRRRLGPLPQLAGQVLIAAVPVAFGLRVSSIAQPFGDPIDLPVWLDIPVSIVWFVGMMNAINWVDVMDGLAGGVALGGAMVLFARAYLFTMTNGFVTGAVIDVDGGGLL